MTITNCATYSQTTSTTTCVSCSNDFYLSSNSCSARTNKTIDKCKSLKVDADKCGVCDAGYGLSSDSLKCLTILTNCMTSSASTTALTCSKCKDLYYYVAASGSVVASCKAGTKTNCLTYNSTQNLCTVCNNKFYLVTADGTCVAHNVIANCTTYHATTKHKCAACDAGYHLFIQNKKCIAPTATIADCTTYASLTTCSVCSGNKYPNGALSACEGPHAVDGCSEYHVTNKCTKCVADKVRELSSANMLCLAPHDLDINQCQSGTYQIANSATLAAPGCLQCKAGACAVNAKNSFMCYKKAIYAAKRTSSWVEIPNCVKYIGLKCVRCAATKYLKISGNNTCVDLSSCD